MNTPASFEIAKLLKEKGFDIPTIKCYAEERLRNKNTGGDLFTGIFRLCTKSKFHKRYYYAPTIAEVVMWLYEKHGIWICVATIPFEKHFMFEYSIHNRSECLTQDGVFDSPTEAYEAAIEYTLKNLLP